MPHLSGPRRIAVFGGIYNNASALLAAIDDARRRGAEEIHCLGDLGGFGPHPGRIPPILLENGIVVVQGNYEDSIGFDRDDCQCGYTDPRDNRFAQIAYDYTRRGTPAEFKAWYRRLPPTRRLPLGGRRLLLCHGSPRRQNEFLWRSTSPVVFLERLLREQAADVILCTHTGLHWSRTLPSGGQVINVGVLGRPANDGRTCVWYALLSATDERGAPLEVQFVPVLYDHQALALEMRREKLPEEFVETILTGWWTTCLEILPARERAAGRF
ncbi:MAG TPA: metallophosphoesterase family protein [Candidatus Polarisedimenticolia bacterium]|nr:metallophosphoesterase family protein [Candidatus Polarisedimenticolia bacterium]